MPDYVKFNPKVEALVMETRTVWDPSCGVLSADDRRQLAARAHADPAAASQISYERTHTGFIREITITAADIARWNAASQSSEPKA